MISLFDDLKEGLQEAIDFEQKKCGNSLPKRVSAEIKEARDGDRTYASFIISRIHRI